MVSDVLLPWGRLIIPPEITDEMILDKGIPMRACLRGEGTDGTGMEVRRDSAEYLEYGKDNYWDGDKMTDYILQVVLPMLELVYPGCEYLFLFDNATNHCSFATDALNARKMSWGPGGEQPSMREGWIYSKNRVQPMCFSDGISKGIRAVLTERELYRDGLHFTCATNKCAACKKIHTARVKQQAAVNSRQCNTCTLNTLTKSGKLRKNGPVRVHCRRCLGYIARTPLPPSRCFECIELKTCREDSSINGCCGRKILSLQRDFQLQKGRLQESLEPKHTVLFYPKFHCELNWIEYYWGAAKRYTREHCDCTLDGLRENVPASLTQISALTIHKFFLRTQRMLEAYKNFEYGSEEFIFHVYKSHRRVGK